MFRVILAGLAIFMYAKAVGNCHVSSKANSLNGLSEEAARRETVRLRASSFNMAGALVESEARSKYSKFDPWLQSLLQDIAIVDEERKTYMAAFSALKDDLISALKQEDVVFKALFSKLHPTGSTYEGLRISHPDEFDMNAILSLPVQSKHDIKIQKCGHAGHMSLWLAHNPDQYFSDAWFKSRFKENADKIGNQLKKWWDSRWISREKVLQWLQSAVAKALTKLKSDRSAESWKYIQDIIPKRSGPAVTLDVRGKRGKDFSIDLVPTFSFIVDDLPKGIKGRVMKSGKTISRDWYLIPKGYNRAAEAKVWRASLWDHEKDLINGLQHFKPLVRLLKKLRDEQNWQFLASYFVKTSALWLLEKEGSTFFKGGIGALLMKGMYNLEIMLRNCNIPFFWDKEHNLIDSVNQDTCKNVPNRLRVVIDSFEKSLTDDSENPMRFFGRNKKGNSVICRTAPVQSETAPAKQNYCIVQ